MKPFLLLATRAEDGPAADEYAQFLHCTGLAERDLVRVRLEAAPMPAFDLDAFSGVIVGGGPFNVADPPERKSAVQVRVEAEFRTLLDEVVARDFPFFGACYGVGTLGAHQGAVIDRTYGEPAGAVIVRRTAAGADDPLLRDLPDEFAALVGHKEAVRVLPASATLLAGSDACPVQMFRVGRNGYATQFHPELDADGISARLRAYEGHGYVADGELEASLAAIREVPIVHPAHILRAFAERYAR